MAGVKRELARGAVISFAANAVGKVVVFLGYLFLARWLGVDGFGTLNFVVAVTLFLSILASVGMPLTLLRFVSAYASEDRWADARALIRYCTKTGLITSLIVMALSALVILYVFDFDPVTETSLLIGLLLIPLNCLSSLRAQTLRALKRLIAFRFAENVVLYLAVIAIGAALWGVGETSAETGMAARVGAAVIAFVIGSWLLLRALKAQESRPKAEPRTEPAAAVATGLADDPIWNLKTLFAISLPLMLVFFSQRVIGLVDVAFLGALSTPEQTGIYSAAARVALTASLALNAINTIAAPMISASYRKGDQGDIKRILVLSCLGSGLFGLAVCLGVALFRDPILGLFGDGFEAGGTLLAVLLIGQLINSAAGPIDFVLSMTGRQKELSIIMIFGSMVALGLCPLLIYFYGAMGAAVATVTAIFIWKLASLAVVWFRVLGRPPERDKTVASTPSHA